MKKNIKKVINRLKAEGLVGKEIIRIKPTQFRSDYGYVTEPVVLVGFTPRGELIIRKKPIGFSEFCEKTLPVYFTDCFWISYKKAKKARNNPINQWRGHYVRRTVPGMSGLSKDISFMETSRKYRLISASRHHVFLLKNNGRMVVRGESYANPVEWELND